MEDHLHHLRHSAAHLLARAVLELYPGAHNAIGPAIETGFYQDFDMGEHVISDEDLPKIEKKMNEVHKQWHSFSIKEVSIEQARQDFAHNPYKAELLEEFAREGKTITETKQGDFLDLCKGGHVEDLKQLRFFKLLSVAGAYWRGDEKNKMLTRIYGTAFTTQEELDAYIAQLAEAKKRDHRKVGKELQLFIFSDLIGPGLPVYMPKGATVRRLIQNFSREQREAIGYQEVHTPNINKAELFKISGHYEKYKDDMLAVHSNYTEEEYFLKPMNCPQHTQVYASQLRSYKDLPIRLSDFANLYRDEKPGEMAGLTRLRAFSQDDAHCFCREDQITEEFSRVLTAIETELQVYGMEYYVRLSIWDPEQKEKFLGDETVWEKAQALLQQLLDKRKVEYVVGVGDAAFYGPKMDFIAKDSLGREWQISTIQIDFNMPGRFGLEYVTGDGGTATPVMIHSALVGSPERFLGILVEHYNGNFPIWLAPIQAIVIAVGAGHVDYVQKLTATLTMAGLRAEMNVEDETVGNKIRKAAKQKVPYVVVVGDKEIASSHLAVRKRGSQETVELATDAFIQLVQEKNRSRNLEV